MKQMKKSMISVMVIFALTMLMSMSVCAANQKVHIYLQDLWEDVDITLDQSSDEIRNIKSSGKNLIAKQRYYYSFYNGSDNIAEAKIALYAKKAGKYTVSYDIYRNNKKIASKKIIVYANNDGPVKSLTYAGKSVYEWAAHDIPASGKLKVTLNKGFKLKKIEIGTYGKATKSENTTENKMTYKTIKNNSKIKLGTYGYCRKYEYFIDTDYKDIDHSYEIFARTEIRITYVDKYTKNTETYNYDLEKLLD